MILDNFEIYGIFLILYFFILVFMYIPTAEYFGLFVLMTIHLGFLFFNIHFFNMLYKNNKVLHDNKFVIYSLTFSIIVGIFMNLFASILFVFSFVYFKNKYNDKGSLKIKLPPDSRILVNWFKLRSVILLVIFFVCFIFIF
jgi:hypothetical protein